MSADRPIFLVGFGRSGSTHIHGVFAFHPNLAWLTRFADNYPNRMALNALIMRLFDVKPLSDLVARKLPPREGWKYWDSFFPGFSEPFRDLTAEDVSPYLRERMKRAVADIATQSRGRVLIKLTGWPRIAFLQEIFPDAKFVHVLRDGRAAANSLLHTEFWRGWKGPNRWRWGELGTDYTAQWERWDQSFIALAALQWKKFVDAMDIASAGIDNFLEVRYEDICANPQEGFRRLAEFCEIDWHDDLEQKIHRTEFRQANYKWQEELTVRQQETLQDLLGETCVRMGYDENPG
ncbi:MAG: sulfotransferase [Gammaproteobacteria bacterium]|nr:sulfotransferase [Gammaproteobacteria bacterium]